MSVFYQAVLDGRITPGEWRERPQVKRGGLTGGTVHSVTRRALKALKRDDAEYRNSLTEPHRRKAYRRELAAELADAAKRRKAEK